MSIDHEFLIKSVQESAREVLSTMLSMELESGEAFKTHSPAAGCGDGVLAFVGLAGQWVGTGSISVSSTLACRLSSRLLTAEYKSIDDDVLDALAELTNIIIGNVKTRLEEVLGPMGLSIPTVIHGRNFTSRTLGSQDWTGVLFHLDGQKMEIQICLAPRKNSSRPKSSFAVHSLNPT